MLIVAPPINPSTHPPSTGELGEAQAWRPPNEQEREERWNGRADRMDRMDAWDRREDRDWDRKQILMIIYLNSKIHL